MLRWVLKRNFVIPIIWIAILIASSRLFFFWDTIQLASKQAHFFFDHQFTSFFLPEEINSGHPPFYGLLLALTWSAFGKSLLVSHLFNMVFVLGFIYQAHILGQFLLGKERAFWIPLVIFLNPVFLGHSILVSPDNTLCFLLLLSINGLLLRKRWMTVLGCMFLALLSMRGMMVVAAIYLTECIYYYWTKRRFLGSLLTKYLPAGLLALAFLVGHYLNNRWLGFHSDSPWQESFEQVSLFGYFRNLAIIGWRLVDFGNIFLWFGILICLIKSNFKFPYHKFILSFLLAFSILFVLPLASFKFLTAHRYFMPLYLMLSVGFVTFAIKANLNKFLLTSFLLLLFLGNLWVYPRSISQGWDVSLAHVPFYSLVCQMNLKVLEREIPPELIGTEFPIKSEAKYLYLDSSLPSYSEGVIGREKYILYSKVINDYKDTDYQKLQSDYILIEDLRYFNIDLKLYEKR